MQAAGFNFNAMLGAAQTATTTTAAASQSPPAPFPKPYQPQPSSQPHLMPIPSATPWNLNAMPWKLASTTVGQADVMQFNANVNVASEALQRRAFLHQKRKSDLTDQTVPLPVKQFISEEKITQHFNGLHISSDYIQNSNANVSSSGTAMADDDVPTTSGKCFTNLTYQDYQMTAKELEEKLRNARRITICDELKKLNEQQRKVSFLPEALLNRIEKPCTALVLWQPPPVLELLHRKQESELTTMGNGRQTSTADECVQAEVDVDDVDDNEEFSDPEPDIEIDDFLDNNNTCRLDFNNLKADGMDEDL